jgi:uncharacterized protein
MGKPAAGRHNDRRWQEIGSHVVPFVVWLFLMHMLGDPAGWKYAARSLACLALFLWLKPWRWYAPLQVRHLVPAVFVGVVVFVAWVVPESAWMDRWPSLKEFYLRWAVTPFGKLPEPLTQFPYAPETCGWAFSVARLLGSAVVIAVIEEFFWRGFLYRWMIGRDFLKVDLGRMDAVLFIAIAVLFGLEHDRWLAGIVAGAAYGWLMIRTRDVWAAAAAHGITNFLLGLYVLALGAYGFW